MTITREFLDGYAAQLEALGDAAESEIVARLSTRWVELREDGLPLNEAVALMRDEAAFALANNDSTYGVASVAIGVNSLEDMISDDFNTADSYDVVPEIRRSDESSARYWAKFLDGTDEGFERFLSGICAKTRRNVTHMADRSVAETAVNLNRSRKKRGGGVRFARVPSGPSCGFCIMLASRGFVYATRETAGEFTKFHDNCDCRIVAETEHEEVEGYNPDELYKRYLMCRESIEHDVKPSWDAMTPDEQKSWGKKTRDNKDAFNNYFAHRVSQEMDTRDREWLWSGNPSEQNYSNAPRNSYGVFRVKPRMDSYPNPSDYDESNFAVKKKSGEWRDLFAHDVLSWNGYRIETRPVRFPGKDGKAQQGASSPDLAFHRSAWGKGYLWEVKSPMFDKSNPPKPGNELSFIGNAFKEAATRNFKNPYDPVTNQPVSDWDGKRRVVLNLRYRPVKVERGDLVSKVRAEMNDWHIHEVILIDETGALTHIK